MIKIKDMILTRRELYIGAKKNKLFNEIANIICKEYDETDSNDSRKDRNFYCSLLGKKNVGHEKF